MARPLRIEFSGAVYHVTSRGNARQNIVVDDRDRSQFLAVLAHVVDRYGWLCHAYCVMDNHYHLLVETPQPNLSFGMRQLNGRYTQSFNRRHTRRRTSLSRALHGDSSGEGGAFAGTLSPCRAESCPSEYGLAPPALGVE